MLNLNNPEFIKELNRHLNAGAGALFTTKRRPHEKHLIIMSDSLEHIKPYMSDYPAVAFDLAKKY